MSVETSVEARAGELVVGRGAAGPARAFVEKREPKPDSTEALFETGPSAERSRWNSAKYEERRG